MNGKVIYNCHNHIFTHMNIPNNYFPLFLVPATRVAPLRWVLTGAMKIIIPWTKNDKMHRYTAFIKAICRETQEENLEHLMGYYPEGTKFVILPMDMGYMGAGKVKQDIDDQHTELARLARLPEYSDILIPFAHIEPRRPDALGRLRELVEDNNFKGVKIYPTLGYGPDHEVLMKEIYPYMVDKNIPLLAHCSPGSVNTKDMSRAQTYALADPYNYKIVMKRFPKLRICLGHFEGIKEWKRHINEPRNLGKPTWLKKIVEMIKSGEYPNLYTEAQ